MTHRASRFLVVLSLALAGVLATSAPASAQRALQQVLDLNRQAMDAYTNLEVEQAMTLLQQALQVAQRGRVTGAPLARTYMNLGVVSIGGMGDNGGGLEYFIQSIQADPNIQLDPLTSTPDIQTTFALARTRAGAGGGGGGGTQVTPPPDTGGGGGGAAAGNLTHVAIPEQLAQTAVPVYIEVPGRPAHVYLYYRGHGMREFSRVEMDRVSNGYGYEIPCSDVFEPEVSYYIVAFGNDGSPLGFAGSQSAPITVPVVSTRTQPAPALPGRAPPTQCGETECPPGMAGCASGGGGGGGVDGDGDRGLGESCMSDQQCRSGNCADGICDEGAGGGGGTGMDAAPRFFVRIGGGMGLSYVSPGMRADRVPCAPGDDDCHTYARGPVEEIDGWTNENPALWTGNGYEPASGSAEAGGMSYEGPCNLPLDEAGFASQACLYVRDPGLVVNFQIRLEVGYYVLPFLGISAFARFQPISGVGDLSFMLIGARLHLRVFDEGGDSGPSVSVHVGGQGGQIQVSVPNNGPQAPWGRSGPGGVHFGSNVSYRFTRNVGIFINPDFIFQFPDFLFNIDVTAGLEFGF